MAKATSKQKNSVTQLVVVAFVIICVSLLVIQIGTNVRDTLDQERSAEQQLDETIPPTATPLGPTPTLDFSAPVQEGDL